MSDNQVKLLFVAIVVVLTAIFNGSYNKNNLKAVVQENASNSDNAVIAAKPAEQIIKQKEIKVYAMEPKVSAPMLRVKSALVKDLSTDVELYNFNTDTVWSLASLTKLMSAVIAVENVGLDKKVVISDLMVATEGIAGNLRVGEQYSVGELVKAMILVSSNDAAAAISEFYGNQNFINKMQAKAAALNMKQTTFADSTGISSMNQGIISDLEKLVGYIDKNHSFIFKLSAQQKVIIFEETKNIEKELLNINSFAGSRPDFLGGKTGFTDEASGNLISLFNFKGHKILITVFGTDDRFGQTEILYNWIKEAFVFN